MPENQTQPSGAPQAPKNKSNWGVVIIIIVAVIIVGGYYWWQETETNENTNTSVVVQKTTNEIKKDFESAINNEDYTAIESYLANTVNFLVDRSDCCGDITKKEVIEQIDSHISAVISYNFWQEQQIVKSMKINLADTFADMTIGVAETGEIIAYQLNSDDMVDKIFITHQMLLDLE